MSSKKLTILAVMHRVPLNSGFLAEKFVGLSKEINMHMLVWDDRKNIQDFIKQTRVPNSKIHNSIQSVWQALTNSFTILYVAIFNYRVKKYLLGGSNFISRLKIVLSYLPIFYIKPDIIHFEFGTLATHIATLKQLTSAKFCISFRGYDINYVGLDDKGFYKDVWQYCDGFHFLGNDLKQRAQKRGYTINKIEALIPAAIDTDFFVNKERKNSFATPLNIYSTGRLTWKKGYEYALQALSILKQKNIPFHYHLIGGGDQKQALQFTIAELGLEKHVTMHGQQSKEYVRQALKEADVFIQPSISEGFCNAVLEAQAMGVPVIATDADGLAENVADGTTGFIVPKWNPPAIADRLIWFHNNREAIANMGRNGTERVRNQFDIHGQIGSFIDLYKKLNEA